MQASMTRYTREAARLPLSLSHRCRIRPALPEDTVSLSHTRRTQSAGDGDVELPRCTKMDDNYYVVNEMYYSFYDKEEALKAMEKVIRDGGESVVLKYADAYTSISFLKDSFLYTAWQIP